MDTKENLELLKKAIDNGYSPLTSDTLVRIIDSVKSNPKEADELRELGLKITEVISKSKSNKLVILAALGTVLLALDLQFVAKNADLINLLNDLGGDD